MPVSSGACGAAGRRVVGSGDRWAQNPCRNRHYLDAGRSVRATASLVKVAEETVPRLLRVAGRHAQRFHDQHVHGLAPKALEFDEQWSFVKKAEAMPGRRGREGWRYVGPHGGDGGQQTGGESRGRQRMQEQTNTLTCWPLCAIRC